MKKTLIALAAVAATGAAFAQSSVTIDGVVDLGIVKPIGAKGTRLDATNGANQIRFRGTEDLGGGLKANFTLAQRFSPESGGADGTKNQRPTFQGESTLGLSGGFGSVKLGRSLTALQGPVNSTDPWGTLQQASTAILTTGYVTDPNGNLDGSGAGRTDAISYTSPNFSGFTVSASLGLKNSNTLNDTTVAAQAKAGNTKNLVSLWAGYANGPLMVGVGTEQNRENDKVVAFLGSYDLGVVRLGGGYSTVDTAATAGSKGKNWNIMAAAPMGAVTLKAGYAVAKAEGTGVKTAKKLGIGLDYALSKRTTIYTSYGRNSALATDKTGYDVGVKHTF